MRSSTGHDGAPSVIKTTEQGSPVSVLHKDTYAVEKNRSASVEDLQLSEVEAQAFDDDAVRATPPLRGRVQHCVASAWFPHLVLFGCQLCFAVMAITSHPALESIPPLPYCTLRIAAALPLLAASARLQEPEFRPRWTDAPWFAVLGGLGIAVPQTTIFVGNHLAGAAYAGVFTPTVPVYVALLSAVMGIEPIAPVKGAGICLSVAGALVLVKVDQLDIHKADTLGMLALLANALSFAVYLVVLQQYLARRPHPFSAFFAASSVGCATVASVAAREFAQVDWRAVPLAAWAALLWAGWGTSFMAHSGICWAVSRCAAILPSIYGCLQPLLTAALAAAALGQLLALRDVGAMGLILAGVGLVIYSRLAEDRRRRANREGYELVGLKSSGAGDVSDGSSSGSDAHPLQRCPSKWHVPGFDSTGHMLARTTGDSSGALSALAAPRNSARPSRPRRNSSASDAGSSPASDGCASEAPLQLESDDLLPRQECDGQQGGLRMQQQQQHPPKRPAGSAH